MTTSTTANKSNPNAWQGWLSLAASPPSRSWPGSPRATRPRWPSAPRVRAIGGMAAMYLLMSLFHLSPWLKLASAGTPDQQPKETDDGPSIVSREDWLDARKALLAKERAMTHELDALRAERRQLPWVRIEKPYVFEAPDGKKTLGDLFHGRGQACRLQFHADAGVGQYFLPPAAPSSPITSMRLGNTSSTPT